MVKLPGRAAQKPRFSSHRGATWDSIRVVLPGGAVTEGWLDTTWGAMVYFQVAGHWRKHSVDDIDGASLTLDLTI